jgi:hypothetical protein
MKRKIKDIVLIFVMLWFISINSNSQNTECKMTVQFTTATTGANFAPKHVLAIWIETSDGQFVRSLKVRADKRKQYLYTWQSESSGNIVDAITGATLTVHGAESIVWNGKDVNQVVVPDGNYKIKVEFTEEHAQGPILEIPFIKNTSSSDSTLSNSTYFTNISIEYALTTSGINNETNADTYNFSVYPNPFNNRAVAKIWSDKNTDARLSFYSINGHCISNIGVVLLSNGYNYIELNKECIDKLTNGTYLLRIEYDNVIKVTKLVKQ